MPKIFPSRFQRVWLSPINRVSDIVIFVSPNHCQKMKINFCLIFVLFIFFQNLNGFPNKRQIESLNLNEIELNRHLAVPNMEMQKVGKILKEIRGRMAEIIRTKIIGQNSQNYEFMEQNDQWTIDEDKFDSNAPNIAKLNSQIGHLLYQGDIQLSVGQAEYLLKTLENSMVFDSGNGRRRTNRQAMNGTKFPTSLWDNRTVPFTFHPSIGENVRQLIRQVLDFWAQNTCLEFREQNEMLSEKTVLKFIRGTGCYSSVGKLSEENEQEISIGEGCEHFGIIAHEVAHALGFFHEQSRWDRDEHVLLNAQNIIPGFEDQFWKELPEDNDNQQVEYDLGSIMHYTESAFSISHSGPVLEAKEPNNQRTMGQRITPTHLDILAMNKRYQCFDKCQGKDTTQCKNGGFTHPRDCSTCICPWGFGGNFCDQRPSSKECGETIEVDEEWRELNGRIGEEKDEFVLAQNFSSCHWHLRAPKGKIVELILLELGKLCSPGCFFGNTELKMRANFSRTGIRVCCPTDLPKGGLRLKSETELAVISVYSRKYLQQFRLKYRFI